VIKITFKLFESRRANGSFKNPGAVALFRLQMESTACLQKHTKVVFGVFVFESEEIWVAGRVSLREAINAGDDEENQMPHAQEVCPNEDHSKGYRRISE
jgi:hypothetical protein